MRVPPVLSHSELSTLEARAPGDFILLFSWGLDNYRASFMLSLISN